MVGSRARGERQGIDKHQVLARVSAGIVVPRKLMPKLKVCKKDAIGIVQTTCEHCGCTNAKLADGKRVACEFCGHKGR